MKNDYDRHVVKLECWVFEWMSNSDDRYVVNIECCFVNRTNTCDDYVAYMVYTQVNLRIIANIITCALQNSSVAN